MEADLLDLTYYYDVDNESKNKIKQKTYYDIEQELIETKSRLEILEEKMEDLLERSSTSLICFSQKHYGNTGLNQMYLIDINCKNIKFVYNQLRDFCFPTNPSQRKILPAYMGEHHGFMLYCDDAPISSMSYDYNTIIKLINQLRNIKKFEIDFKAGITTNDYCWPDVKEYVKEHFDMFKQIIELNTELKIIINVCNEIQLNLVKDLLQDINILNILSIGIKLATDDLHMKACLKNCLYLLNSELVKKIKTNI